MKLEWLEEVTSKGVRQRRFDLHRNGRVAPGLLWTPEGAKGQRPLILVCHGAGNHKAGAPFLGLARSLVRHKSFAVAAIDGPVHGDRRSEDDPDGTLSFIEFASLWANDPTMADEMVADWRGTLDALWDLDEIGGGPVGWWGLSMGTILGIPVVAAEPRITAAVLGLMGTSAPNKQFRERFLRDASSLSLPVLFIVQWDDELMPRRATLELFDLIGSSDKRLHAHPGAHTDVPMEELVNSELFFSKYLDSR